VAREVLPEAKKLRDGSRRAGYRVGDYVIKENVSPGRQPLYWFKKFGIESPQRWFARGWEVQPFYYPVWDDVASSSVIDRISLEIPADIGEYNLGWGHEGQLVAYDW